MLYLEFEEHPEPYIHFFRFHYILVFPNFTLSCFIFIKVALFKLYCMSFRKSAFKQTYNTKWFSTNNTRASIHTGISWMHKKKDNRLLLNFTKFFSYPSKALLFISLRTTHMSDNRKTIHAIFSFRSCHSNLKLPFSLCLASPDINEIISWFLTKPWSYRTV